jgi:hypothetical protein
MKKLAISILVVSLMALALTNIVMAQDISPQYPGGRGPHGGGGNGLLHDYMIKHLADLLGLEESVLNDRLAGGESLSQIAAELGLSADEFFQLKLQARLEAFKDALADGAITQEQFDILQERTQNQGQGNGFGQGNGGNNGKQQHGSGVGFGDCPYDNETEPAD